MSKKTTIILFTLLFIFVFLVGGFFIIRQVYYQLLDNLIDQYAQEELVLAKQTAHVLENEIKSTEEKLNLIAKIPAVRDGSVEECTEKLQEFSAQITRISNIGRVGLDKKFKCSLNAALVGTDAEKLGPYITDIFNDPNHQRVMSRIIKLPSGGYAVAIHVPVFSENGQFDGTIGGAIYFDEFSKKFLQDVNIADQGYVVLQDDDGTIFYHPQKDLIGQNRRPKNPQEEATASAITKLIIDASKDGTNGVSRYISTLDHQEKVGAYAPADIFPGRKWVVVVTVPIQDIQGWSLIQEARKSFWYLLIMVIACIMVPPLLILIYLNFSVFKPLEKIGKAASEIGNGNLDVALPIKSKDEIGRLAGFFNDMVLRLKSSYLGLEERVKEKTAALSQKLEELQRNEKATLNILEDLDESKQKIQREKAKDEAILSSIGDGIIATDQFGIITLINSVAGFLLGRNSSELVGQSFTNSIEALDEKGQLIPDQDRAIHQALVSKQMVSRNFLYSKKDGTKIPVAVTVSPIIMNGEPIGAIEVFRDITHEKEVDRMKSEFISLASHQLRTPLSAMKWFSEMLLAGDAGQLTTEQKEYIQNIYDSNERMVALVNALLNISRIESGRMIIEPKPTDLKKLVEQVLTELKPKLEEKKMQMVVSVKDDLPMINVDAKLIQEVP